MFIDYENIKYYWNLFDRAFFGYKKNFLIITVIGFLSGLVGGLGIGSLIPLVSFVTETGQTTDIISTSVRRVFSLFDIQYSIPALLIMMVVLFFSKAVLNLIAQYINAKTAIDFENKTRVKNKKIVGGMVGKSTPTSYQIFNPIKDALTNVGIEIKDWFSHETKQDALNFYEKTDFQVIWYHDMPDDYSRFYRYPGKIINAGSFGIPTIAQDILGHQEMEGCYISAATHEDIVREALKLQDDDYYNKWSKKLIEKAKEYHISKIAKLYRKLK